MNILLVNYGQADNNSAQHIFGFARGLAARGHDVVAAMAKVAPGDDGVAPGGFRIASHRALLQGGAGFAGDGSADVLHVWTPRENVRLFAEAWIKSRGARALVIHLEDNEEAIFHRFTGKSAGEAEGMDHEWPRGLIHPPLHRRFLASAQGLTLVHRCLSPLATSSDRVLEIVPPIDFDFFSSGDRGTSLRAAMSIAPSTRLIVYNGNDHAAAIGDIRLLYDMIDLLIERGCDVALVRTGHVLPNHYDGVSFRPGPRCHELGFIARGEVPRVMSLADVVIQPGNADVFNSFRLPAKIPEYLSMGKPLIMGSTNIGLELGERGCAIVLPLMTVKAMAERVEWVLDHPGEAAALGGRAREFALERFDAGKVLPALEEFYGECIEARGASKAGN